MGAGWWITITSTMYLVAAALHITLGWGLSMDDLQYAYVVVLTLPLWVPPLARLTGIKCIWEKE